MQSVELNLPEELVDIARQIAKQMDTSLDSVLIQWIQMGMDIHVNTLNTDDDETQTITIQRFRELEDLKTRFFADLSHDLRNPITALGIRISLLERAPVETYTHHIPELKLHVERLRSLLDDVLDLSHFEDSATHLDFVPIDINQLMDKLTLLYAPMASEAGLIYRFVRDDSMPIVMGNEAGLIRCFSNLITNAIRYTDQGEVKILLRRRMTHVGERVYVLVVDTGIGIPQDELSRVFQRMYRGEDVRGRIFGTGLGLAIVKEIVELHGGSVDVQSQIGKGTTFTVALPTKSS